MLSTSMIGLAVGQIFFGPLSDRYGRRIPLQVAMWLFIVSTIFCLFAQNIQQFVAFRLIQGIAGAGGIVIARSIATDKFSGKDLAKMLAIIGAINGIAPVVAPIIGGVFTEAIGWQGIFIILLVLGVLLLIGCMRFRESLPAENRLATKWADTFNSFKVVLRNKQYVCYVLQLAFAQGVLFAYIASSPFIIQQHYGYSPFAFSICFSINAIAIGGAAAFSVKFRRPANGTLVGCMGMLIFSLLECSALALGCSFWMISCGARLAVFDIAELREVTSYDELSLDTVGDKKTALFLIMSDTDPTFNFLISMIYTQLFNLLCEKADDVYGGRLPVHVRCLIDECANIGQIPNLEKLVATIRSREISACLVLQAQSQLKAIYKDNADTIIGNMADIRSSSNT